MSKNNVVEILDILHKMYPEAKCELDYHNIYELSIAVMLSAQTTDKAVNKVTKDLFNKYHNYDELSKASFDDIKNIIQAIGLANNKAHNIINMSKMVMDKYNGNLPNDFDLLITLPGIGRKTANVILSEGFHIQRIAVDTHVERVSKRLNLVDEEATPLEVEERLMEIIPNNRWHEAHHLFIFFGRYLCSSRNPKCGECPFNNNCLKK